MGSLSVGVAGFSGGGGMLWVPVVEIKGFGDVGRRRFVEGDGLAVGEKAATDGGAVLGGFWVAVEEVEFVFLGFGNWGLRVRVRVRGSGSSPFPFEMERLQFIVEISFKMIHAKKHAMSFKRLTHT